MIFYFKTKSTVYAVESKNSITDNDIEKLSWLFDNATYIKESALAGFFIGPPKHMISPWSTNAVEITQNMGVDNISRIEKFTQVSKGFDDYDKMLEVYYTELNQQIFEVNTKPEPIIKIEDISKYNKEEGLSLSDEEVEYLENVSVKINRKLTDSEVFGFSQVNSEHCRHKIFNGDFIIDGKSMNKSLFSLIKETSKANHNTILSAYKDNVAFIEGPEVEQFSPKDPTKPSFYEVKKFNSVISLKAETHNFPTTVEPFNGAATGSGGEIRDRMAGGQGSIPMAGTAVYMTSYPRIEKPKSWEQSFAERKWLYQSPMDILIKASNGASDFGNKFGQPLINGSLLTFEHQEGGSSLGYDKVIMQAGGIGYGKLEQVKKQLPQKGDAIVVLGGDNYRIGMGGAAVSSANTGDFKNSIELNAIQRSNPEMQNRVANTIRAMVEADVNTIRSIHDHGAGGHLNCLSELVEDTGGHIDLSKLPVGDPTLSAKEIIGNESQERMGLVISKKEIAKLKKISERERSPFYEVGEITNNNRFTISSDTETPMDLHMDEMFGSSPKTILEDSSIVSNFEEIKYDVIDVNKYLEQVLQLESVACKDWLTNKVDRCVGGKVAQQQCVGPLQLPLSDVGVMALDYKGKQGIATGMGHAPVSALIDAKKGSRNAIAESLTNIIWAPLQDNIKSVSLSANWMWACRNPGEDARLYQAVEAVSEFAIDLGINIPTGKDSLSMTQNYKDKKVIAPGTVIISATAHCSDIKKIVNPVFSKTKGNDIFYINMSKDSYKLGGSSFAQTMSKIGTETPDIKNSLYFRKAFDAIQDLIKIDKICAGHDVSAGGIITTLLEMCFADNNLGADINLSSLNEKDIVKLFFSENSGIVFQTQYGEYVEEFLDENNVSYYIIGSANDTGSLDIVNFDTEYSYDISKYRDIWYKPSYLLDDRQTANGLAKQRFDNYKNQALSFVFPSDFDGKESKAENTNRPKAAILREKGSNSEREMANALYLAGFDVKDVHMTDLIEGRETLEDIQFIGAVGGFSNSDVLGSAKGWAGAFKYNEKAKKALENFYKREDTLSLGICNGSQLFVELGLLNPNDNEKPKMTYNDSAKHESNFTSVKIQDNNSVMLSSLAGSTLGVWISHGEGKYKFPYSEDKYSIVAKYGYKDYPANPNGSDFNTAMFCSNDGRHLAMMPHIERSIFAWNWAYYPKDRKNDYFSPWKKAFDNALDWIKDKNK